MLIASDSAAGADVEPFLAPSPPMLLKVACWHDVENLGLLTTFRPDLLVIQVHWPDARGMRVARRVRSSFPALRILTLVRTSPGSESNPLSLELGSGEVLRTSATGPALVEAVHRAATGQGEEVERRRGQGPMLGIDRLTGRERDVLALQVAGQHNDEIAEALVINPKTVEFHVSHLLAKLHARSRTEAVTAALRLGLATLDQRADRD